MNKPPAFQFYVKDWLTSPSVAIMTTSQRGLYIQLLARAWDSDRIGYLPDDPDVLWKLAGAASREAFEIESELVLKQFPKAGNGWRVNKRLLQERQAQERRRVGLSVRGIEGAKARWDSNLDASAISQAMPKNSSSSSTSSSTSKTLPLATLAPRSDGFETFWAIYPRKVGKPAALRAWKAVTARGDSVKVMYGIELWKKCEQWIDNGGKFIPHPATFLNQQRYNDTPIGGGKEFDPFDPVELKKARDAHNDLMRRIAEAEPSPMVRGVRKKT